MFLLYEQVHQLANHRTEPDTGCVSLLRHKATGPVACHQVLHLHLVDGVQVANIGQHHTLCGERRIKCHLTKYERYFLRIAPSPLS